MQREHHLESGARFRRYLTPQAYGGLGLSIVSQALPYLFPNIPRRWVFAALLIGIAIFVISFVDRALRLFVAEFPRPWFPIPFWRVKTWLRYRPSISIITAFAKPTTQDGLMTRCDFNLTIRRNLSNLPHEAVVHFESAKLTLTQVRGKNVRKYVFNPKETGGFLAFPMRPKTVDAVVIEFCSPESPFSVTDAPNFARNYELELSGIWIRACSQNSLRGPLPSAKFHCLSELNAPQFLDGT